jgi:RNA methyltransferase, TrmH family
VRITEITSKDNPRLKQIRSLRQRSKRQATGLFLVEGIRHVGEAVEASEAGKARLAYICFSPQHLKSDYALRLIEAQAQSGLPCYSLPPALFESLADKENPQGILAVVHRSDASLDSLDPENFPWGVALVAPQDPGNIGAILRTIDAVGASGLILLDSSADPYQPGAVRASMGSIFWYPVVSSSFSAFADWSRQNGYNLYGTSARGSLDIKSARYEKPLILLMGSEREGLTAEQASICRQLIRLPMLGRVTSLNLGVATGVFLYDILAKN